MRICTVCDLKNKEIICLADGARLGYVCDAEFDLDSGQLTALLVPGEGRGLFARCPAERIAWCDVERIGGDVILVRQRGRIDEGKRKEHI